MEQTVIGIFDSADQAKRAVDKLLNSGFDRGLIDVLINDNPAKDAGGHVGSKPDRHGRGRGTEQVRAFFQFALDDENERMKYIERERMGASIITVKAQNPDEGVRISQILDECGAVDVDESVFSQDEELAGPTSHERDYFSPSDEVASRCADDDLSDESRPVIVERKEDGIRGGSPERSRSRIVSKPMDENVRMREERVAVRKKEESEPL